MQERIIRSSNAEIPLEAEQALRACHRHLSAIAAAYLHGSAVAGGLRPDSDVDLLVVLEEPPANVQRASLTAELLNISGRPGSGSARPIELIAFSRAELESPPYPARCEFIYGEWLRAEYEGGAVPKAVSDPELTLLLAQARGEAKPLIGPPLAKLLPAIEQDDIRRATRDLLPALMQALEGDERNVLLALARMWRTLETGEFVSKDQAAEWAMKRLSAGSAELIGRARHAYLGGGRDGWADRRKEVRSAAAELHDRVVDRLDGEQDRRSPA